MTPCSPAACLAPPSRPMRLALAAGLFVLTGVASAQDPAGAAGEPATSGGACVAGASLGALSLAPAEAAAPASAVADAAGGSSAEGTAAPAYQAAMPEGFVSLAGNVPPMVASCVASGAPTAAPADAAAAAPATEVATAPAAEVTPAPAAEPAPAPAPAPAAAPEVAAEPVAEAPRAAAVVAKPRPAPAPAPRPRKPPAEALKTWWPAAEAGKLNLRFAGEAAFGEAIALLFDAPFSDPSSLAQHVEVKTRAGKTVEAKWQVVKSNPQMVALRVPPGLYQVRVGESLAAANGLRFQRTAEGKIFVR